jgi:hypothetical protein
LLAYHGQRGLQVESTLGVLVQLAALATGGRAEASPSFGSMNLDGTAPSLLAKACGPIALVAIGAIAWRLFTAKAARGPARVAGSAFLSAVALWLTGKVFSPQYMTWGIPLVLAIPGKEGLRLAWGMIAATAITQLYLRGYYDLVAEGAAIGVLSVAARQGILAYVAVRTARNV